MIFFKLFLIIISVFALHRSGIWTTLDGLFRRVLTGGVLHKGQTNFNYNVVSWLVCITYLVAVHALSVYTATFAIVLTTLVPPVYNALITIINKIKI